MDQAHDGALLPGLILMTARSISASSLEPSRIEAVAELRLEVVDAEEGLGSRLEAREAGWLVIWEEAGISVIIRWWTSWCGK